MHAPYSGLCLVHRDEVFPAPSSLLWPHAPSLWFSLPSTRSGWRSTSPLLRNFCFCHYVRHRTPSDLCKSAGMAPDERLTERARQHSLPTWSVYRTSFSELPLLPTSKSCLPFYSTFICKNKLTLLYAGIQNSWSNSLQLEEYDGDQIREAFINEGRGHSPTHLKFFLLVFSKFKEDIK